MHATPPLRVSFQTLIEDQPGSQWQALFGHHWPSYRAWFLRSGSIDRPSYLASRRALREHMPELLPLWQHLVELAGGGDVEARFLSMWCPPPYIAGCAQGIWLDPAGEQAPLLLRNYDFAPALLEGCWAATRWLGQQVLAMSDCLWGALDGQNEAGLAMALSFGGRKVHGEGFGIPLLLRYVLETCQDTPQALVTLQRVPVHMSYNVTVLDARGHWATVFLNPDRPPEVRPLRTASNLQHTVEWPAHAQATRAVERLASLHADLLQAPTAEAAMQALLHPPVYQDAWLRGFGTLYSASYQPATGQVHLLWPGERWSQSLPHLRAGARDIQLQPPVRGT